MNITTTITDGTKTSRGAFPIEVAQEIARMLRPFGLQVKGVVDLTEDGRTRSPAMPVTIEERVAASRGDKKKRAAKRSVPVTSEKTRRPAKKAAAKSMSPKQAAVAEKVVEFVKKHPDSRAEEVKKGLGMKNPLSAVLAALKEAGRLKHVSGKSRGAKYAVPSAQLSGNGKDAAAAAG